MNTADRAPRIPELDGLRGAAILFVVLFHFTGVEGPLPAHTLGSALQRATILGWTGVDLFFVLSGFLIGGILVDVRRSPRYWRTFYLRRFLRIIPIYYLWILAYILLMQVAGPAIQARSFSGRAFVLGPPIYEHFLFAQNIWIATLPGIAAAWFGHTWSLAVEEQFYLVSPLLVRWLSPRQLPGVLLGIVVASPILRSLLLLFLHHGAWLIVVLMPCRADSLAVGMLAALAWRSPAARAWLAEHLRSLRLALAVLSVGAFLLWAYSPQATTIPMQSIGYSWMACFYVVALLLTLLNSSGLLASTMRAGWLRELGRVSYCVYIIHLVVNSGCHALLLHARTTIATWQGLAVTVLAAFLTYGLAKLSWLLLEGPLLKRGHRFTY